MGPQNDRLAKESPDMRILHVHVAPLVTNLNNMGVSQRRWDMLFLRGSF